MTKNIRERAPEGAEYFAFDVSGVSYFKIKDGIPHLWFEGSWEPVPDTVSEFMSLHPMGGE